MTLRLAIVADIHHGAPALTKRADCGLRLLEDFAAFANDAKPDLVLDLGDRISDRDHDTDMRLEAEVAEGFRAITAPVRHICGNHDRDFLSVAENEAILGQSLAHEILDIGTWRVVLWRADSRIRRTDAYSGFFLPEDDLVWLARTVQAADRPLLVVSHVPVSGQAMTGNYWFENVPDMASYPAAWRVRAALAQCRHPVVCLAGHVHWTSVHRGNGITYLTQQSLTESYATDGEPAGAMGLMELDETLRWRVEGLDPFDLALTPNARRWVPPMRGPGKHRDPDPQPD